MTVAPLKLLSSMATRDVLAQIIAGYERDTGRAVRAEAAGGVDVARRVAAGEAADVVILARAAIDKLMQDGHLDPGSCVDLVESGIAVAVPAGRPKPDLRSEASLRHAVLTSRSVSYSTGPSGTYLRDLFERWGILDRMRDRIVVPSPGVPVGELVARGAVDLGFQQSSELSNVVGIDVAGPLPPEIQSLTTFSGAVSASSGQRAAARELLQFLAAPEAADIKRRYGMDPA